MLKKGYIFLAIFILYSCNEDIVIYVESVDRVSTSQFSIRLNRKVSSFYPKNIYVRRGALTGSNVPFTLSTGCDDQFDFYMNFDPPLKDGVTYYVIFHEGTFQKIVNDIWIDSKSSVFEVHNY